MPSSEGHIHWGGVSGEVVEYLGQSIKLDIDSDPEDPTGALHIYAVGFGATPLFLPNSTNSVPTWSDIPGTSPTLQARQDGHYPSDYIRIRQA